jgi:hypothetical protein
MTSRNVLIALAGATVVVGAVACGGTGTPNGSSQSPTATTASTSSTPATTSPGPSTPVTAAPSACDELGGRVGPDQMCTVHTETAGYTIDMSFPVTYPDQQALADVLVRQRDQFVQTVTEPPVRDVAKALDIKPTSYRSGTPDAGTVSLVLEEYVNVGGAHPETYYDALNYDLGKKAPITFDTLFKPGTDPVAVLDPIVENELKTRLQGALVDANPIGAEMYKNFALTDDAVIFFIGQGMWTFEAAGAQQVSVPRSELASILA